MMEIVLATRNSDKVREIRRILPGIRFLSLGNFPQVPEIEENGETLEENAIQKAQEVAVRTGKLALADDSGLEVEALRGRPGVKSARFAGEGVSYEENNKKLLLLMSGKRMRRARFRCVVALSGPGMETMIREGVCRGRIAHSPRGKHGFGYDPVFIVSGMDKTFAELTASVKNDISHRARALRKLGRDLSRIRRES
jgi:XTP/dITP diphosphohydrolase